MSDYYAQGGACKTCTCKRHRERYALMTPEQVEAKHQKNKAFSQNNRDKINEWARARNKKPSVKAWYREYWEKNREVIREKRREYYQKNHDALVAYKNKWYHENPEKWVQYYEAYMAKPDNREKMNAKARKDREELSLGYVNVLLGGTKHKRLPTEMLEAKRVQIQIRRALEQINQTPQGISM